MLSSSWTGCRGSESLPENVCDIDPCLGSVVIGDRHQACHRSESINGDPFQLQPPAQKQSVVMQHV